MDQDSVDLLNQLLIDRIRSIRETVPRPPRGRGHRLVDLVQETLSALDGQRQDIVNHLGSASGDEQGALGRRLLRLLSHVGIVGWQAPFLDDVGRRDLPVGLLQAVESLIEALLTHRVDPTVHVDEHHMYSTLDLVSATNDTLSSLDIQFEDPRPVIFLLPMADPHNALLIPILAHEVGHAAIEQNDLGSQLLQRVDRNALDRLFRESLEQAPDAAPSKWQMQLVYWIDELLCDALATVLTGPSFLFASIVFLPAPELGQLGTHPYPSDRVALTLKQLHDLGWREHLENIAPNITRWAEDLRQPIDTTDPRERFLRGAIDILEPALLDVAREHVRHALRPKAFQEIEDELDERVDVGIPPAQLTSGAPASPWAIILSAWLNRIRALDDRPDALAQATADRVFNAFVLKAIEMSRITTLWENA